MSLFCVGFRGTTDFFKRVRKALLFLSLSFFLCLSLSTNPRREEKRRSRGKRVTRVMTIAHASILTTFSTSWSLSEEFFFVSLPSPLPQLALSFSTVCRASSPIHDRLTRGKEREGGKEISVFPPQLYAAWFYL